MIKQECIGIPDMILLLMIFLFKKIKIKAEIVLSPGGAYFNNWDELSPFQNGTNCRFVEFGTNCRLERIVAWDKLLLYGSASLRSCI